MKKNLDNERDTRWRTKGHRHKMKEVEPKVCSSCKGTGHIYKFDVCWVYYECKTCQGTGEIE